MPTRTQKICPKCEITKPVTDFYTRVRNGRPQPSAHCKECILRKRKADRVPVPRRPRTPFAELTREQVTLMNQLIELGVPVSKIARQFNINHQRIRRSLRN